MKPYQQLRESKPLIQRYELTRTDDRYDDMEMIENDRGQYVRYDEVPDVVFEFVTFLKRSGGTEISDADLKRVIAKFLEK